MKMINTNDSKERMLGIGGCVVGFTATKIELDRRDIIQLTNEIRKCESKTWREGMVAWLEDSVLTHMEDEL